MNIPPKEAFACLSPAQLKRLAKATAGKKPPLDLVVIGLVGGDGARTKFGEQVNDCNPES